MDILLTQYSGAILGPIAKILGWVMNGIFVILDKIGIQDIGLSIIMLTFIIYLCMLPLTIKQQKFSKLSQIMQPEIQEIQKKYGNKTDTLSRQKMAEETQEVYQKYGVSATGSCLQLFITFPILLALYRVIMNVPAYVNGVKNVFTNLVNQIYATDGFADILTKFVKSEKINSIVTDFHASDPTVVKNYIVDLLYHMPSHGWNSLQDQFASLSDTIQNTHGQFEHLVTFLGLNISDSPLSTIKSSFSAGAWGMLIMALLIPILSYLTQVLNIKLMPQPESKDQNDAMASQMKMMNRIMPLFSFFMCFSIPVGLGIYWIAGAVFRGLQQVIINKHMKNLDMDALIAKNMEKMKKRREKMGISDEAMQKAGSMNTRRIKSFNSSISAEEKERMLLEADDIKKKAAPASMAAKANLVREFNEGHRSYKE